MLGAGLIGVAASSAACSSKEETGAVSHHDTESTRNAMIDSLAHELGSDRESATSLIDTVWPLLFDWTPPTAPPSSFDFLLAFAFGNRLVPGSDPTRIRQAPGPANAELAHTVAQIQRSIEVPIYAQWEIADILRSDHGMGDVISIDPLVKADGTLEYLSTAGVAAAVAAMRKDSASSTSKKETAGIIGFADHAWRCVKNAENVGFTAAAPEGVSLPNSYDNESGQEWTRSRSAYLSSDFLGRIALLTAPTRR